MSQGPSFLRRRWKALLLFTAGVPVAYRLGLTPIPCGRGVCLPFQQCVHVEGPGTISVIDPAPHFETDECKGTMPGEPRYSEALLPSTVPVDPGAGGGAATRPPLDVLRGEVSQRNVRAFQDALTRARGAMRELPNDPSPKTSDWKPVNPIAGMVEGEQLFRAASRDGGAAAFYFAGRAGFDYRLFASAPGTVAIVRLVPNVREQRVKVDACGDGLGGAPKSPTPLEISGVRVDVARADAIEVREVSYASEKVTEYCDNPLPMP